MTRRAPLLLLHLLLASAAASAPAASTVPPPAAPVLLQTQLAAGRAGPADAEEIYVPLPPPLVIAPEPTHVSPEAWQAFFEFKDLRSEGRPPLCGDPKPGDNIEVEFDCRLWRAAMSHSLDMGRRGFNAHRNPDGETAFERSRREGLGTMTENIGVGYATSEEAMRGWKEVPGTCKNMFKEYTNRVGVAHALVEGSPYSHYWTMLIGRADDEVDKSCYPSTG
mmetsp:Transcript_37879/g.109282  ORF Transcript_37879/g.109282 Transcript_37879/m.109282 type:complete len:222 (-) Transcript_37879:289-954(-)